ncbi:hypothetical protein AB0H97_17330 [Streptomyces sp. NPDC050788]|uniref:hypothetical protein n=1 Tax=Streptomyces sp. NPDC050788 TaxID=3155041 RepID=UPI0034253619
MRRAATSPGSPAPNPRARAARDNSGPSSDDAEWWKRYRDRLEQVAEEAARGRRRSVREAPQA